MDNSGAKAPASSARRKCRLRLSGIAGGLLLGRGLYVFFLPTHSEDLFVDDRRAEQNIFQQWEIRGSKGAEN